MSDAVVDAEEDGFREEEHADEVDEVEESAFTPLPSFHRPPGSAPSPAGGKHQRQRQSSVMGFLGNVFTRRQTSAAGGDGLDGDGMQSTSHTHVSKRTASISLDDHGEVLVAQSQGCGTCITCINGRECIKETAFEGCGRCLCCFNNRRCLLLDPLPGQMDGGKSYSKYLKPGDTLDDIVIFTKGPEGQKQRSPRTQAAVDQWMKDLTAVMALNIGQPKIIKKKAKEEDKHEKQGKRDKLKEQLDRGKEQLQKKMEAAEQKLQERRRRKSASEQGGPSKGGRLQPDEEVAGEGEGDAEGEGDVDEASSSPSLSDSRSGHKPAASGSGVTSVVTVTPVATPPNQYSRTVVSTPAAGE